MAFRPLGKKSQLDLLKTHFDSSHNPTISAVEASALYRIRALPRRIKDLEEKHHMVFTRERRVDPTGQRYVRYVRVPVNAGTQFADR
jgi:hypothetical protein